LHDAVKENKLKHAKEIDDTRVSPPAENLKREETDREREREGEK